MKKTINGIGIVTVTVALLLNLAVLGFMAFVLIDTGGTPEVDFRLFLILSLIVLTPLTNLYVIFKFGVSPINEKSSKNEKSLFGLWIALKKKKLKKELND